METYQKARDKDPYVYFSILWWIGVMETPMLGETIKMRDEFQYPLVDWGDGDW